MAGDWIKVEIATPDKPEIVKLASLLGIDQDSAFGKCVRFWMWADQQTRNGNDLSVTTIFIDRLVALPGFAENLKKVGWLAGEDLTLRIPNFDRHNGKSGKTRALTRNRVQSHRNADVTHEPLAEKRREDIREESSVLAAQEEPLALELNPPGAHKGAVQATDASKPNGQAKDEEPVEPPGFTEFWLRWPTNSRKVNRAGCLKAWVSRKLESDANAILAGLRRAKESVDWTKEQGRFIPLPATWMNQRRWEAPKPGKGKPGWLPTFEEAQAMFGLGKEAQA